MEGTIHIVAINPRELWIDGKDVVKMEKTPPRYEWNGCQMRIVYADGHVDEVWEPVLVEFVNQKAKPEVTDIETETPPPPAKDYENDKLMVVYEEIDRMEIAEREQQKREHPNWRSVQKKGNGVRFLNIAKANDIETVGQLLKVGRVHFEQLRNMGPYCVAAISQALKNLYGIETW